MYVGLKQDVETITPIEDIEFESEEVTGSLFNDKEIEETVHRTYQIHKNTL